MLVDYNARDRKKARQRANVPGPDDTKEGSVTYPDLSRHQQDQGREARRLFHGGLPLTRIARVLGMSVAQVRIAVGA
jgi:hypothetical protein